MSSMKHVLAGCRIVLAWPRIVLARRRIVVAAALLGCASASFAAAAPALEHRANDDEVEVAYLIGLGTADSLATASLLTHLIETSTVLEPRPDSTVLIDRAVALAPRRPELVWLQLRDCEMTHCAAHAQIAAGLRSLDPGNGITKLSELYTAPAQEPAEATRIISEVAASPRLVIYWNKLVVMMFDAMTHAAKSPATALTQGADDRLSHATGVLTAVDVPAFRPLSRLCRSDQFAEPGRRAACERLMPRLDESDSVIAQTLSPTLQEGWYSPGTPKNDDFRARRMQLIYLVQASGRARGSRVDDDALRRVDAMRRLPRETDVEKAMLAWFKEPLERPDGWASPTAVE